MSVSFLLFFFSFFGNHTATQPLELCRWLYYSGKQINLLIILLWWHNQCYGFRFRHTPQFSDEYTTWIFNITIKVPSSVSTLAFINIYPFSHVRLDIYLQCLQYAAEKGREKKKKKSWNMSEEEEREKMPFHVREKFVTAVLGVHCIPLYQVLHTAVREKMHDRWKLTEWTDDRHACRHERKREEWDSLFFLFFFLLSMCLQYIWQRCTSYKVWDGTLELLEDYNTLRVYDQ